VGRGHLVAAHDGAYSVKGGHPGLATSIRCLSFAAAILALVLLVVGGLMAGRRASHEWIATNRCETTGPVPLLVRSHPTPRAPRVAGPSARVGFFLFRIRVSLAHRVDSPNRLGPVCDHLGHFGTSPLADPAELRVLLRNCRGQHQRPTFGPRPSTQKSPLAGPQRPPGRFSGRRSD